MQLKYLSRQFSSETEDSASNHRCYHVCEGRNMLARDANIESNCSLSSMYGAVQLALMSACTQPTLAVAVCQYSTTPLTYLRYAGLWVAVFLFCRFRLLVAGITGHHVIRQAAHFSHTETSFACFGTLDVERWHKTRTLQKQTLMKKQQVVKKNAYLTFLLNGYVRYLPVPFVHIFIT